MEKLTRKNIIEEPFEYVELYGRPALLTKKKVDPDAIPYGWYCYELQKKHKFADPENIGIHFNKNFFGSVILPFKFRFCSNHPRSLGNPANGTYGFEPFHRKIFLNEFCEAFGYQLRAYYWDSIL